MVYMLENSEVSKVTKNVIDFCFKMDLLSHEFTAE